MQFIINNISVMYSKYLDYTDVAVKAHQAAQVENDQKDILIAHLKSEVYELRQLQGDFLKLNDLILALEEKYSLLLDEKQRSEKEQRVKSDIDKNSIIGLKEQIQTLRVYLQKANLEIEDLMRENTGMKRMSDARASQIQNIRYEIKGLQNKNDRAHQQNKDIANSIKILKQERKKLEDECEKLDGQLDSNIAKLKNLQKQIRNSESINARLDKTLHQAENDNIKLVTQLKQKNDQTKKSQTKLHTLHTTIQQLKLTHQNLLQHSTKSKSDSATNYTTLCTQIQKGKQLNSKLNGVQASIRAQQIELDNIVAQEQKLRKQHFIGINTNKNINMEINRILTLIHQYEQVNKELLDEIEMYIQQDQRARVMLNRRDQMREIIESCMRKIAVSGEPIKHLKY